ncbi:MAG: TlpA disulfide reductase family protein [Crocinitomicaceae bacterium]|nr:TlpA disulfide reductase family protein [Crocinitomicaceae bacterium]
MKLVLGVLLLFITSFCFSQSGQGIKLKKGSWVSELTLSETDVLPFTMRIKKGNVIIIENAEEEITLLEPTLINDSLHVRFPYFNSELVFKVVNKKKLEGYWINYTKGPNYRIPFSSERVRSNRFTFVTKKTDGANVDGQWQVDFEPNTNSTYPAVGIFKQKEGSNSISGTFLTETGDYRFLEGNSTEDSLFLSCFDGSHAFLFKAALKNDSLYGAFFSGNHWQSEWQAGRNENYQITSPDDLTYIVDDNAVTFDLKTLSGSDYSFPNDETKGKVVIIQIMGTWCPNCLDETHYYKELYNQYHDQGLEIISIGYEAGNTFEDYAENIERLKTKIGLDFTFLVGGNASKGLASEHFNMLNEVISFPTSIFIGRDGKVKRVHTGFNGPGTGSYYREYVEKTNALVESLLNQ